MKVHNGMRPQDIVILLKLLSIKRTDWQYRDLATDLFISVSEVSASLTRSHIAGLVDESRTANPLSSSLNTASVTYFHSNQALW
jgi:predicted transcriptional regulator